MATSEAQTALKQKYLREKVMDQGYNPGEFADFLEKRKKNGTDIASWTFQELIWEVEEFKNMKANNEEMSDSEEETTLSEAAPKKRTKIQILKSKKIKSGLLSWTTEFTIETIPQGNIVKRTIKDFDWLRAQLILEFPCTFIPPISCKNDKMPFFQNFLNNLAIREKLFKTEYVQNFLKAEKLSKIYKKMDVIIATRVEDNISQYVSPEHRSKIDNEMIKMLSSFKKNGIATDKKTKDVFADRLDKDIEKNKSLMSKMKHVSVELGDICSKMAEKLFEYNKIMKEYMVNVSQFDKSNKISKEFEKTKEIASKFLNGVNGWGTWCLQLKRQVYDHLVYYMHYSKHELMSLQQVIKQKEEINVILKKSEVQLTLNQKRLWREKKLGEWGTSSTEFKEPIEELFKNFRKAEKYILPKEQKKVNNMKIFAMYSDSKVIYEYFNLHKMFEKTFVHNFRIFGNKIKKTTENKDNLWYAFEEETPTIEKS